MDAYARAGAPPLDGAFGHDQHRRRILVPARTQLDNDERPALAEWDRVAAAPVGHGAAVGAWFDGVPSSASSLKTNAIGLPSVCGWDRTARASLSTTTRIHSRFFADTPSAIIAPVRFTVTIEGAGWTDVQQLELPRLPREGELIETKYGTCQVTHSEATPEAEPVAGKIVCSIS